MADEIYPSPRPVIPFEKWLHGEVLGDWSDVESGLVSERGHFETRLTYLDYLLRVLEDPQKWLFQRYDLVDILNWKWHAPVISRLPPNWEARCQAAKLAIFRDLFEPYVSVYGNADSKTEAWDLKCWMWWDGAGLYLPGSSDDFYVICRYCLASPNPALHWSALHGLGHHLQLERKDRRASALVDEYIASGRATTPRLAAYARDARRGRVQ